MLAASIVIAVSVPLTRLAHHALLLRFLSKQLEHTDSSARLEVSLVIARQLGALEASDTPTTHKQTPATSRASVGSLTQVEPAVRRRRR